jgi:hypothetical protein
MTQIQKRFVGLTTSFNAGDWLFEGEESYCNNMIGKQIFGCLRASYGGMKRRFLTQIYETIFIGKDVLFINLKIISVFNISVIETAIRFSILEFLPDLYWNTRM